jgi:hypothetical protein
MITMDHPLERSVGGRDDGSQTQDSERRAHLRTANCCEEHALLLDRYGAHHAANIERHNAELEREAADAARRHE